MKCLTWAQLEQELEGCCTPVSPDIGLVGLVCTRRKFHVGPHHAHTFDECLAIWRDPALDEEMHSMQKGGEEK